MLRHMADHGPSCSRNTPTHQRWHVRPRSVSGLLLASFALVALPLIVAILFGVVYVDRLTEQSERLVLQGVQVTRYSKRLDTILTTMERSARQYSVLREPALAERFAEHAEDFDATLDALRHLELDTVPTWNVDALRHKAASVAAAVRTDARPMDDALAQFESMRSETALIADQGNRFIDNELQRLQRTASHARTFLLLCVFALIPGVLLLVAIFTVLISRPIRQISAAISRLGAGDFSREIRVAAPSAELDALGARLDWMRRRLATLENEKNQFLRHMSHELKTPLASIREGTEVLRDGTVGALTEAQAEVADILQRNSLELLSLIENLLNFAAWRQQQAKLEYTRFDVRALAEEIVRRQKLTIEGKHLDVTLPDPPVELVADRDHMHLIIDNLLANAVKFSPERGRIRLQAERVARATRITLCDQGPGVAEDERERIFDAFYQGSTARARAHVSGTGVGLSVVRDSVRAHGGTITVSDAPDGGACFCLSLPDGHGG